MLRELITDLYLSVSQLNDYVSDLFLKDELLSNVLITGEVSSFRPNASGHLYFTLKDENAAVRCVMFRSYASRIGFQLENGMKVRCAGNVTLYKKDGQYQLNLKSMEKVDDKGELYRKYLEIKERLEQEGLFDAAFKRPLPKFPKRIGVVTSSTGAVIRDIITVSLRRNPGADILLYPAKVQGKGSAEEIIRGIRYLNGKEDIDVIIIGRGGGSMEDLFEFNDEALARAIRQSEVPIVSAVGHETDFTIADFAADVRAATPSAAAELCSPDVAAIVRYVDVQVSKSKRQVLNNITKMKNDVRAVTRSAAMNRPRMAIGETMQRIDYLRRTLEKDAFSAIKGEYDRLETLKKQLSALNPGDVLKRGYSAVVDQASGKGITSIKELTMGQMARIYFADGSAEAMFTGTIKEGVQ